MPPRQTVVVRRRVTPALAVVAATVALAAPAGAAATGTVPSSGRAAAGALTPAAVSASSVAVAADRATTTAAVSASSVAAAADRATTTTAVSASSVAAAADRAVTTAASAPVVSTAVRAVPERRGRGSRARLFTRVDAYDASGVRHRVATVPEGGLAPAPVLSPDGRHVALAQDDGRIAVVTVGTGRVVLLAPAGRRPEGPLAGAGVANTDWHGAGSDTRVAWSADGRRIVASGLLERHPLRYAGELRETRSVVCDVRRRRCSAAGRDAPAVLVPLGTDRLLRIDGTTAVDGIETESNSIELTDGQARTFAAAARRPVPLRLGVLGGARAATASSKRLAGPVPAVRAARGTLRTGVPAVAGVPASGPAGVLVRLVRVEAGLGPVDPSIRGRSVGMSAHVLRPWLVDRVGRVRTLPVRLPTDPVGTLADGRWLLPSGERNPHPDDPPAPQELTALDARGTMTPLRVDGRPVTAVRLALEAGLPDAYAVAARVAGAWADPGDPESLLVHLVDLPEYQPPPGDGALVRLRLDGARPAQLVDHRYGAGYDVR